MRRGAGELADVAGHVGLVEVAVLGRGARPALAAAARSTRCMRAIRISRFGPWPVASAPGGAAGARVAAVAGELADVARGPLARASGSGARRRRRARSEASWAATSTIGTRRPSSSVAGDAEQRREAARVKADALGDVAGGEAARPRPGEAADHVAADQVHAAVGHDPQLGAAPLGCAS